MSEDYPHDLDSLDGPDVAFLDLHAPNKWHLVCEHLGCAPPACSFPELADLGQRQLLPGTNGDTTARRCRPLKHDKSPWIAEPREGWQGINSVPVNGVSDSTGIPVRVSDRLESLDTDRWIARDDTFTDNLALFRPSNIEFTSGSGATLAVRKESLGVREYSAAALTSRDKYLFGRFEAVIKASNLPGVVTGFFLHRDSPRQEIDVEIAGNRTDRLLVNVFYNPGAEGTKFDYGYRGSPNCIHLGFDASESYHRYVIEWEPCEIRWFVDDQLIHRRSHWQPTPIPHLPMFLHANTWPTRSKELAGRLASRRLPSITSITSIRIEANQQESPAS